MFRLAAISKGALTPVAATHFAVTRSAARTPVSVPRLRKYADETAVSEQPSSKPDGYVIGVHDDGSFASEFGSRVDLQLQRKISSLLAERPKRLKEEESMYMLGLHSDFPRVAVVSLGNAPSPQDVGEKRESSRTGAAIGVQSLQRLGSKHIVVDPMHDVQGAAEGAHLAIYEYTECKSTKDEKERRRQDLGLPETKKDKEEKNGNSKIRPLHLEAANVGMEESGFGAWNGGKLLASAQNFARDLMNAPSNRMTPREFVSRIRKRVEGFEHVELLERDEEWVKEKGMSLFRGVAQGSNEPLRFLELHYRGRRRLAPQDSNVVDAKPEKPLVLVGKGVTFDTGGIDIKPSANMYLMKGDMGGAATVMSAVAAVAELGLGEDVIALAPLCENMPSGTAIKPGDVLTAMDGTTVEVDNTDAEGRLLLADALTYAQTFDPSIIIDVATLTGAMHVALGHAYFGYFTNSHAANGVLHKAMTLSGESGWQLPLADEYLKQLKSTTADLLNCSRERGGGACTAAMFLKHFIRPKQAWMHLDIAGVMDKSDKHYIKHHKSMTGIPTRTLAQFIICHHIARQQSEKEDEVED